MASTTRDENFVPGGSVGTIEQIDLTTRRPQTVAVIDSSGNHLDSLLQPTTTNGYSTMNATSSDGASALTNSAQVIKASAGKVYGYYIYNPNVAAQFVQFYNTAAASVTVGTTSPLFMLTIPAGSAANLFSDIGITFGTAISWAATSTAGGNGAPSSSLDAVVWYK